MISGIYKLTFPNGKIYIGQSIDVNHRLNEHRLESLKCYNLITSRRLRNITKLRGAYRKYPWNQIDKEILEVCKSENLNERETYYIFLYDSFHNGLNCTTGGEGGFIRSPETLEKMRYINLGKYGGDQSVPFYIDGVRYVSILAASVALKIPPKTIHNRLNSKNIKYNNYLYEDENKRPKRVKPNSGGPIVVSIDGVQYNSATEAAQIRNESTTTIIRRCRSTSKKFVNYKLVKQP